MNYYYRDKTGVEIGPLTLDALAKLRFAGVLDGDTSVRASDSTEWKSCREIIADLPQAGSSATPVSASAVSGKSGVWQHGWSLFALAVLCFLLPFIDVSCRGTKVTLTGQQLVTGTELQQNTDAWTGRKETKRIDPYPAAQCALGLGVAAFLLSLARKRTTSLLSGLAGAGGAVGLFVLKSTLENEIASQGQGLVTLNIREEFWLAAVLLAGGAFTQFKFFNEAPAAASARQIKNWKVPKRYKVALVVLAIGVGLAYGGVALYKMLSDKATLSLDLSLDGKPLPVALRPNVLVDGKPLRAVLGASGWSAITLGRHKLSVQLENTEPFEHTFWVFYGNKNLGVLPLESSKGSLLVTVNPAPAAVIVKHEGEVVGRGDAPLHLERLPVGEYLVLMRRGEYEETNSIKVEREQQTEARVELNLGSVDLSSDPPGAEFELWGNGRKWGGKLPTRIDDVPGGNYSLVASRKGWVLTTDILINRGSIATNKTEFEYGSIILTSEPTGMTVSTNGVQIGKAPITLRELRPGQYALTATDGENDLMADVAVSPKEVIKYAFVLRYGTVELATTPMGATVTRRGKEVGKTPLTLGHLPPGETTVKLQLEGYVSTNVHILALEGTTTNLTVRLVNERYFADLNEARRITAVSPPDYRHALESINDALQIAPSDGEALQLRKDYEFGLDLSQASELFEKGDLDGAQARIDAAMVLKPSDAQAIGLKERIVGAKVRRDQVAAAQEKQRSAERAESAGRAFEQMLSDIARQEEGTPLTAYLFASETAVWRIQANLSQTKDALQRAFGSCTTKWRVDSEDHPASDITVIYLSPKPLIPGIGDRNIFGQKVPSKIHLVVQLCQLPNSDFDVRVKEVNGIPPGNGPDYAEAMRRSAEAQFIEFRVKYYRELTTAPR